MKLALDADFTRLPRAGAYLRATQASKARPTGRARLAHDERHLRRRAVTLEDGARVLVDLPETVALEEGDRLVLDDGGEVAIVAAPEELHAIRPRDAVHLAELAWHIGNRHLAAALEPDRILILRDHVIKAMLEGLGATVTETIEPFRPVRGAYSGQSEGHAHHAHEHGKRDQFGRTPGDPHYGHSHG